MSASLVSATKQIARQRDQAKHPEKGPRSGDRLAEAPQLGLGLTDLAQDALVIRAGIRARRRLETGHMSPMVAAPRRKATAPLPGRECRLSVSTADCDRAAQGSTVAMPKRRFE